MSIQENQVVSFHYTLTNAEGQVLDSSEGRDPLDYLQGHGNIIPGLEKEMAGKEAGDSFTAVIPPEEGYGVREESLTQKATRDQFQDPDQVQVGAQFHVRAGEHEHVATITAVEGDEITLDLNHPLAGETLTFEIQVMAIREATAEELEHGHVHSPGGHAH